MNNQVNICPNCESDNVKTSRERLNKPFGLDPVVLENVKKTLCNDCGHESVLFKNHGYIMNSIREGICLIGRKLRGKEIAFLRNGLGLSQIDMAKFLGTTNVSVSRWESGRNEINDQADLIIKYLTLEDIGSRIAMNELMGCKLRNRKTFSIDVKNTSNLRCDFDLVPNKNELQLGNWEFEGLRKVA